MVLHFGHNRTSLKIGANPDIDRQTCEDGVYLTVTDTRKFLGRKNNKDNNKPVLSNTLVHRDSASWHLLVKRERRKNSWRWVFGSDRIG
jgi:hypothetical protein